MTTEEVLTQLFSAVTLSPAKLAEYAARRQGYVWNDCFGVAYPHDLDAFQRQVEGASIQDGFVEVMYWDGAASTIQVNERDYIDALHRHLKSQA